MIKYSYNSRWFYIILESGNLILDWLGEVQIETTTMNWNVQVCTQRKPHIYEGHSINKMNFA